MPYATRLTSRRAFLKSMVLGAAGLSLSRMASAAPKARPNFVVIIGDDVGWNDVGAYGNPRIRTPHVDAMAQQGMQFNNAYLTISSCSPSRASIMTGLYPHNTGAGELHQPLAAETVTIPALLKEAGYYTACVGKFHMGHIQSHFDFVVDSRPSGSEHWLEVLGNRPKDKPFFFWLAAHDSHRGWSATEGPAAIAQPHQDSEVAVPPFLPDAPEVRRDLAQYYDEVCRLDHNTGLVLEELERQGVLRDTFVLFMSDNGRPFPRAKTTVYDSGLKTPFIVQWPDKVKAGSSSDNLVSSVDIAPTIIELAGLGRVPSFEGKSFTPILEDPVRTTRDYVYGEHNWHDYMAHERSVRSLSYLYIRNAFPQLPGTPPADAVTSPTYAEMRRRHAEGTLTPEQEGPFAVPRPEEQLFDVREDPYSFHNLAADPNYADVLATMREECEKWVKQTGDRVPENPTPDLFDRETGKRLAEGARPKGY